MNRAPTTFDDIVPRIEEILDDESSLGDLSVHLVRDLYGRVRIVVEEEMETDEALQNKLKRLANLLSERLGKHAYPPDDGILFVSKELLATLEGTKRKIRSVYLADRLLIGKGWWTVKERQVKDSATDSHRVTLFSVKGGVGRTTTAAVLASHLADKGERVLVVDLDLESPGLSSAVLEEDKQPKFGVTDWLVEDLVGQGDRLIGDMQGMPFWADNFDGDIFVVPAHGKKPGEYLAKLGRVYMDMGGESWAERLRRMLKNLESEFRPTITLLESRSGLHDVAAATVTDLEAEVLLFAVSSDSSWTDYEILFKHWNKSGLAKQIRDRLSIVSALTPVEEEKYLSRFRERAWLLFQKYFYDAVNVAKGTGEELAYDIDDEDAPHAPLPIQWARSFAFGAPLRGFREDDVKGAYGAFLERFDRNLDTVRDRKI